MLVEAKIKTALKIPSDIWLDMLLGLVPMNCLTDPSRTFKFRLMYTTLKIVPNQGFNREGGDLGFGLFGFSDFRKLVFLDPQNFEEISRN